MRKKSRSKLARVGGRKDAAPGSKVGAEADAIIERAVASGEPAHVARYAFQLAQTFNNFYHLYPILSEPDRERKVFLLWMTDFFRRQLERTGAILGIQIPEYM